MDRWPDFSAQKLGSVFSVSACCEWVIAVTPQLPLKKDFGQLTWQRRIDAGTLVLCLCEQGANVNVKNDLTAQFFHFSDEDIEEAGAAGGGEDGGCGGGGGRAEEAVGDEAQTRVRAHREHHKGGAGGTRVQRVRAQEVRAFCSVCFDSQFAYEKTTGKCF